MDLQKVDQLFDEIHGLRGKAEMSSQSMFAMFRASLPQASSPMNRFIALVQTHLGIKCHLVNVSCRGMAAKVLSNENLFRQILHADWHH